MFSHTNLNQSINILLYLYINSVLLLSLFPLKWGRRFLIAASICLGYLHLPLINPSLPGPIHKEYVHYFRKNNNNNNLIRRTKRQIYFAELQSNICLLVLLIKLTHRTYI
jgi:hypothetical protein